jgi:hypothetical protein
MKGRSQMQGGKNWILPKEINANTGSSETLYSVLYSIVKRVSPIVETRELLSWRGSPCLPCVISVMTAGSVHLL